MPPLMCVSELLELVVELLLMLLRAPAAPFAPRLGGVFGLSSRMPLSSRVHPSPFVNFGGGFGGGVDACDLPPTPLIPAAVRPV